MRSKLTAVAAAIALASAIAACGSFPKTPPTGSATPPTPSAPTTPASPTPAASGPGAGKPAVTLGDKNFTEEYILGQLYAQARRAKGYTVKRKSEIGSSQ